MKIKYDLQVFHNIVLLKVFEMDEKYRSSGKASELFTSTNGLRIYSGSDVGVYSSSVYVLGEFKDEVYTSDSLRFDTNKEAQEHAYKVKFALEEWNNYVHGD